MSLSASFSCANRLLTSADYRRVFERSKKTVDDCFVVLYRSSHTDKARLGLAISKKTVRRAVDRNRIKRIVRESFRNVRESLDKIDAVVLCRDRADSKNNRTLRKSLDHHWARVSKIRQRRLH